MELFTVTNKSSNNLVSLPLNHVVALGTGRFTGSGQVSTTAGGAFDTVESYSELVQMWKDLTGTGE